MMMIMTTMIMMAMLMVIMLTMTTFFMIVSGGVSHKDDDHDTVKPLLSGPPIKRTPSIKGTLSLVPKLTCYISLYNEPLFSGHLY